MSKKSFRVILPQVLLFATSAAVSTNASSVGVQDVDFIKFSEAEKRISWVDVGEAEFPLALSLRRETPAGRFSIGLVHLGYSAPDPDGKSATLTFAIQPAVPPSPPGTTDLPVRVVNLSSTTIDISLDANPAEEARLRSILKLPRPVQVASSSVFQVKWRGVDGEMLYNWLVSQSGLRWRVNGLLHVAVEVVTSERIDDQCAAAWWDRRVSLPKATEIHADAFLVTSDLANAGCFVSNVLQKKTATASPLYKDGFVKKLNGPGANRFSYEAILQAGGVAETRQLREIDIPFTISFLPGGFLASNPAYVKDLSGSSIGLEGLRGK